MNDSDLLKVLRFLVEHDVDPDFYGADEDTGEIWIATNCNDLFFWACADMEEYTVKDLSVLEQAIADCDKAYVDSNGKHQDGYGYIYAPTLYACRIREMRPQNPCYSRFAPWLRDLLDRCGPDRPETGDREKAIAKYEASLKTKPCQTCSGRGRVVPEE